MLRSAPSSGPRGRASVQVSWSRLPSAGWKPAEPGLVCRLARGAWDGLPQCRTRASASCRLLPPRGLVLLLPGWTRKGRGQLLLR
eukprot:9486883-Heterocapsa_arctica.AAC.1